MILPNDNDKIIHGKTTTRRNHPHHRNRCPLPTLPPLAQLPLRQQQQRRASSAEHTLPRPDHFCSLLSGRLTDEKTSSVPVQTNRRGSAHAVPWFLPTTPATRLAHLPPNDQDNHDDNEDESYHSDGTRNRPRRSAPCPDAATDVESCCDMTITSSTTAITTTTLWSDESSAAAAELNFYGYDPSPRPEPNDRTTAFSSSTVHPMSSSSPTRSPARRHRERDGRGRRNSCIIHHGHYHQLVIAEMLTGSES